VANTSVSIIGRDDKKIAWHALIDVGLGVVTSLCNIVPPDDARLDWLLLTHWHPDHCLELNRLCETLRRSFGAGGKKFGRIPIWCRNGTGQWLRKNHSYEWHRFLNAHVDEESHPPGVVLDPTPLSREDLAIVPFTVSHNTADLDPKNFKNTLYCSASFIIETARKKAVILWDIDDRNDWILSPATTEQKKTVAMASEADYLFIDCLAWNFQDTLRHNTGHVSFQTVRNYARILNPRKTFLVHISGHEAGKDADGWGWSNDIWEEESRKVWKTEAMPGSVHIPSIGDEYEM
jgi:ribonuclease BN (tRNA processing enzyme)